MTTLKALQHDIRTLASDERATISRKFFKMGPGSYGVHDQFLGVTNPQLRKLAKQYDALLLKDHATLLQSPFNEERLLALFLMINQFQNGDEKIKSRVYTTYLQNLRQVNNWNLVDASAHQIMGVYLLNKDRTKLKELSEQTNNLWFKRIAIVATLTFIKNDDFAITLEFAEKYFNDPEDLIHKATGWMLREVGKKSEFQLLNFLEKHIHHMPRTMLRYAIEKLPNKQRLQYLKSSA